jgi:DNA-binding LytR/AlgR family response regulator
MIRCAIIDDEPLALDLLEGYVRKTPFLQLAGRFDNALSAMEFLHHNQIDLFFLDIQMPALNGMDFSKMVGNKAKVIFTTAFQQYAVEGFRVDALDYLLKPISYQEFLEAANKALRWFEMSAKQLPNQVTEDAIFVKTEYKLVQIKLADILYIESSSDYVKIFTETTSAPVLAQLSMKIMEERLPSDRFVRVHRSFIVQLEKIKTIEHNRIVFGKTHIPISDSYKTQFFGFLHGRSLIK